MTTQLLRVVGKGATIGRDPRCDYVVEHPLVSARHARFTPQPGADKIVLEDLGSSNGTYVNGHRLRRPALVGPADVVQIGPVRLRLSTGGEVAGDDLRLAARIDLQGVGYELARRKRRIALLRDISLTIEPGELVALMGPAGAGKTTLLEVMNGTLQPTSGRVLVNGVDLHRQFDALRGHIGYVPQDDIVHRNLTVYQACYYTARMRLRGVGERELHDRVVRVIEELDLAARADTVIGGPEARVLSGGQRKRVNLAMELVTDPALLFLDEPTSGLSSADARGVMQVLEALSERGRTIIVTIHQPSREIYEAMDNALILGVGGRLIYFGPVTGAYRHFGTKASPDALFEPLAPASTNAAQWEAMETAYRRSTWHAEYVAGRAMDGPGPAGGVKAPRPRASRAPGLSQLVLLIERLSKLYTRDLGWLVGAALGAPLLMLFLTSQLGGTSHRHTLLFVASMVAYFFGIFPGVEMIQGERTIYARERMVNLKIPSYVLSKALFLLAFGVLQAFSIAAILTWYERVDATMPPVFLLVFSVQATGVATGLLISTLAPTSRAALLAMLACVILMIALSGFVVPLPDLREDGTEWLLAPSPMRWGLGGLMDLVADVPSTTLKGLGFHRESWPLDAAVNAALAALPLVLAMVALRHRDRV
jgi:ABC transport system ATP-binding/permease protein